MKRRYGVMVQGKRDKWMFPIDAKPEHAADWKADGLEVIEIAGTVPAWLPHWATRIWCFLEDCFYFRNPFAN